MKSISLVSFGARGVLLVFGCLLLGCSTSKQVGLSDSNLLFDATNQERVLITGKIISCDRFNFIKLADGYGVEVDLKNLKESDLDKPVTIETTLVCSNFKPTSDADCKEEMPDGIGLPTFEGLPGYQTDLKCIKIEGEKRCYYFWGYNTKIVRR